MLQKHTKHIKISPSYSWTTLHCETINCVHHTGPKKHSILLSVSHTLYVNQVCHGVNRCAKDRSCSLLSLEWKSVDGINRMWWISYYLNKCWTLSDTLQTTIFLSGRQSTGALCVQHSPTAAALSTNTAFEWKMWFSCFPVLPSSVEAQLIWGGILKHLLITYFIGNVSTKNLSKSVRVCQKVARFLGDTV